MAIKISTISFYIICESIWILGKYGEVALRCLCHGFDLSLNVAGLPVYPGAIYVKSTEKKKERENKV